MLFLIVALFCFGENCLAEENSLIISEILIDGVGGEEFIELYNPTAEDISLQGYFFTYYSPKRDWDNPWRKKEFPPVAIIKSHKFYLIGLKGFNETIADWQVYESDQLGNSAGSIAIFPNNTLTQENAIDFISWGDVEIIGDGHELLVPIIKTSLERINTVDNNWQESFCLSGSPGKESTKQIDCPKTEPPKEDLPVEKNYSDKIIINELFPAPTADSGNEEFIELYNLSEKDENLSGWILRDSSKTGKYTFPESITIKTKSFLVVAKKDFEFALNNSGGEKVLLFNPAEKEISRVEYTSSAKTNYSYAFNGTAWQWTSKATKGLENKFDEVLSGEIKKDKIIYVNMYTNFEATTDDKAKHFTWNFGDGHKSYLKKTRHKYEKTGKYLASLKVTGEGADNLINFEVVVEKFGKAKVQIISLSPNPKGLDSKNEWLEILNATKKKIDLKGWSIATGWKNLTNHPITKKFILKSGEARKLTRDFCAFSLGNKQAKIELRYPDGKVADKIKYDRKDDSIAEDEIYQKENSDWQWLETQKIIVEEKAQEPSEEIIAKIEPEKQILQEAENADFDLADLGKYSEDPIWRQKQAKQNALLFAGLNISPEKILFQNQSRVLGVSSIIIPATKNSDQFWKRINAKLNEFIWFF